MNKCIVSECNNEAHCVNKFCEAHTKLFDNVNEVGMLKATIRKRNLMIKDLRKVIRMHEGLDRKYVGFED